MKVLKRVSFGGFPVVHSHDTMELAGHINRAELQSALGAHSAQMGISMHVRLTLLHLAASRDTVTEAAAAHSNVTDDTPCIFDETDAARERAQHAVVVDLSWHLDVVCAGAWAWGAGGGSSHAGVPQAPIQVARQTPMRVVYGMHALAALRQRQRLIRASRRNVLPAWAALLLSDGQGPSGGHDHKEGADPVHIAAQTAGGDCSAHAEPCSIAVGRQQRVAARADI